MFGVQTTKKLQRLSGGVSSLCRMSSCGRSRRALFTVASTLHRTAEQQQTLHRQQPQRQLQHQHVRGLSYNQRELVRNRIGQPLQETHPHLMKPGELLPGIAFEEIAQRRRRLIESLPTTEPAAVVLSGNSTHYMSNDIPYLFRQQTDFLYLTGCQEPDSVMLLLKRDPRSNDAEFILFVRARDPSKELWEGSRVGVERAAAVFSADRVFESNEQLPTRIEELLDGINLVLTLPELRLDVMHKMMECKDKRLVNIKRHLHTLRAIKAPSEIELMQQSANINVASFVETLKRVGKGMLLSEQQVGAQLEYECKMRGAQRMAYPPVVAGGISATTLHYITNEHLLRPGELVLVDSGCEYNGYASDISRTFPVNSKFTTAQKSLYECVLQAHDECIKLSVAGASTDDVHHHAKMVLKSNVNALGITKSPVNIDQIFPHAIGHHLGMDTHDVQAYPDRTLLPGMVITIEPGLYIPDDDLYYDEFRGVGIRIEDDVLITDSNPHVLTQKVPTSVQEIEELMSSS